MFITRKSLSRRTFLQGIGTTISLPLLDAMSPALTAQSKTGAAPLTRYGFMYIPHGVINEQWIPVTAGPDFEFKPIMKPLEPFRNQLTVVGGLDLGPHPQGAGHTAPAPMWLSGVGFKETDGADVKAGTTIDQMIAQRIGRDTPFPSLELAAADLTSMVGACETGFSCTYLNTIAWSTPTTPLPMESNPRTVFERMFGDPGTKEQRLRRISHDRSILDAILGSEARLSRRLSRSDRARLGDYLESVREIERRIEAQEKQAQSSLSIPESPAGIPSAYEEHVGTLFDLMAIAYQADITRVVTFMLERELSNRSYPQVGSDEAHHGLSHHGGDPVKIEKFTKANTYHVTLFSRFLEKLRDTPDGDGSLLDHSLLVFGSGMGVGNTHAKKPLPVVVAGGANGGHHGNRHIAANGKDDTPMANLLVGILDKAGLEMDGLGYSTGHVEL